jgi:hypothetical protein
MYVGIAWYRPEDYDRLMKMFTDRKKLPDTFEDWLKTVELVCDELTRQGHLITKAYIDPEAFPQWCRAK